MAELVINVVGTPVQQGSKVANRFGHGVRDTNAKKLKPWRAEVAGTVAQAMADTGWATLDGPIQVELAFFHHRPAGHYGTGRNAGRLKPSAPVWKATAPDIDKLTRAILDALTDSRAIRDDARVARLVVEDRYADAATGARITITPLNPQTAAAPGIAAAAPSPLPVGDGARPNIAAPGGQRCSATPSAPATTSTPVAGAPTSGTPEEQGEGTDGVPDTLFDQEPVR